MSRDILYRELKERLTKKTEIQLKKELDSYRSFLMKNKDSFFHKSNPEELTDGLRIMAIKEALEEKLCQSD